MEYDQDKVDEMVLALLYLTSFTDEFGTRAWKGHGLERDGQVVPEGIYQRSKA